MARDPLETRSIRPETTPLYASSVYTFPDLHAVADFFDDNTSGQFLYRRNGHPNDLPVTEALARLEGTEAATLCASGMAAITQACMAHLRPGDHVLATSHLYGGTYAFFEQVLRPWGVDISYVNLNQADQRTQGTQSNTRVIYAESIANPLLQVADILDIAAFAQARGIKLFVDNTFATPLLMRPVTLGATLSIHSVTKYINGHSDVIGGAVVGSAADVDPVRRFAVTFGGTLSPFDAWLTERGLQTLHLRFPAQCHNALALSHWLSAHPAIERVHYPGLPTHESHALATQLLGGQFGAMLSFSMRGGFTAADALVRRLQHISFAPSLGGVHTTLSHPALTSHRAYTVDERSRLGIDDGLLRLSVGAEPISTLQEDFQRALS